MSSKVCTKCAVSRPLDQFYAHKGMRDGRRPDCKQCMMKQHREYVSRPSVRVKKQAYHKKYNANLNERQKVKYAATISRYCERTPRMALSCSRNNALRRFPTANPISLAELMEIWEKQGGRCAVSGVMMTWRKGRILPTSLSIDRLVCSRGYESGNVRLVCYCVNAFRHIGTDADMLAMAKAIVANLEQVDHPVPGLLSLVG